MGVRGGVLGEKGRGVEDGDPAGVMPYAGWKGVARRAVHIIPDQTAHALSTSHFTLATGPHGTLTDVHASGAADADATRDRPWAFALPLPRPLRCHLGGCPLPNSRSRAPSQRGLVRTQRNIPEIECFGGESHLPDIASSFKSFMGLAVPSEKRSHPPLH